mgnify:CR=1 FL=1
MIQNLTGELWRFPAAPPLWVKKDTPLVPFLKWTILRKHRRKQRDGYPFGANIVTVSLLLGARIKLGYGQSASSLF